MTISYKSVHFYTSENNPVQTHITGVNDCPLQMIEKTNDCPLTFSNSYSKV